MFTDKYKPQKLEDIVGQNNLTGKNGILTKMLKEDELSSCIFYGPPGCGKTTTAKIIAKMTNTNLVELNAVTAGTTDIKNAVKKTPVLIYLDEIQYFNKKQQQSLLPFLEQPNVILIASTTENPYYCCYDALLSRCFLLEFLPIKTEDVVKLLNDISKKEQINISNEAIKLIAQTSSGDIRRAINLLDIISTQKKNNSIDIKDIKQIIPSVNMSGFDLKDDIHYNLIAALQKSIRGSDPNAAIFYLARLLEGGDILSPCRRLLVIASEDIGFGNPDVIPFVYACVESAKQLGMPEARLPLTNAVLMLAISPKCSTAEPTYDKAANDVHNGFGQVIPPHLCKPFPGYKLPHNYPNHWVKQQYLPNDLQNQIYYIPGDNQFEQSMASYWSTIIKK